MLSKATKRETAINKYCWSKELNYYVDYNFKKQKQSDVVTLAGMYPFCIMKKTSSLNEKCSLATSMLKEEIIKSGRYINNGIQ